MIGSIKIFITITIFLVLSPTESSATNKNHLNLRHISETTKKYENVSDTTTRLLATNDIIKITSSLKPKITRKSEKKISNILMDLIYNIERPSLQEEIIRKVEDETIVLVDVVGTAKGYEQTLLGVTGIEIINCYEKTCSMYIPINKIKDLASYSKVALIRASMPRPRAGKATSEGIIANGADQGVPKYKENGDGLMIGVLSDTYNCGEDYIDDSLPPPSKVKILSDVDIVRECFDVHFQGRAMMEVIHNVAPEATLAFYTSYHGEAASANGIIELASAGCDIIVDDFFFLNEPFFQDGIVSQAIEQVVAGGVTYITSVGDDGSNAWDAPNGFVSSGKFDGSGGEYHRFSTDRNGQPIITQSIGLPNENRDYYFSFQWDESSLSSIGIGSRNDLDIFFLRNGKVFASGIDYNVGYDPIETIYFNPYISTSSAKMVSIDMVIKLYEGPAPKYMKVIAYNGNTNMNFQFGSSTYSTVSGHALSASGISVGAANTPAFGKSGPIIESFSSRGGTPTIFDRFGARQINQFRLQPVVTGPDGVSISFSLPHNSENLFIGTAASAAHVAGVAALLLQAKGGRKSLSPFDIAIILRGSAIDMDDPKTASFDKGFDYRTGHGFVDALAALNTANCYVTWNLYNSQTDKIHSKLVNGNTIDSTPLCTRLNIEAVVPCGRANGKPVLIELYKNRGTEIFRKSTDTTAKYFLFGNKGTDVYDGRIPPGTYTIRANVNGVYTPKTTFTLRGGRCK